MMTAARNGEYSYDPNRTRSRAQANRLCTSTSTTSWDKVADVRNGVKQDFVKVHYMYRNRKVEVQDDPYADLRDCII